MLSIRSYRGNQTESPQRILHLHDCLILNSGLGVKRITMLATTRPLTIIRFSKPAAKGVFSFNPQLGLGNDFVACLFQKDKVFPLQFQGTNLRALYLLKMSFTRCPLFKSAAFHSLSSCRLPVLILSRPQEFPSFNLIALKFN